MGRNIFFFIVYNKEIGLQEVVFISTLGAVELKNTVKMKPFFYYCVYNGLVFICNKNSIHNFRKRRVTGILITWIVYYTKYK